LEPLAYIHRDKLYYSDESLSELCESAELVVTTVQNPTALLYKDFVE